MQIRVLAVSAACLFALGLGGCGDSGPSTEISATLQEFKFSPTDWTVAAGQEITLDLENTGAVLHEFVILKPGVTIASEADLPATEEELLANFVYWEIELENGQTTKATFTAPPAGTYQVICATEDHFNAGMKASLTSK